MAIRIHDKTRTIIERDAAENGRLSEAAEARLPPDDEGILWQLRPRGKGARRPSPETKLTPRSSCPGGAFSIGDLAWVGPCLHHSWWFLKLCGDEDNQLTGWMRQRLYHLEMILSERAWLVANRFTVADLLMADVLRVPEVRSFGDRPATEACVIRATDRPSFKKAQVDQIRLFESADEKRTGSD